MSFVCPGFMNMLAIDMEDVDSSAPHLAEGPPYRSGMCEECCKRLQEEL